MGFGDDERDLDETASKMIAWLSPKLSVPPDDIRIEGLDAPLGTGFSSDTLLFNLVYNKGGEEHREGMVARWKDATGLDTSNFGYYVILALARFSMNMARVAQYRSFEDGSTRGNSNR